MARESWRDSLNDDEGGRGGFLRRVFGEGDNPMTWAVPIYRAWGILVTLHIGFLIYIVLELLRAIPDGAAGIGYRAVFLFCLFGMVLLHEYGHCFACRKIGGEADRIMMWPLGGLASCLPPHGWKPSLITTIGGPAVNAVLIVPLGLVVLLTTRELGAVVFNPFALYDADGPIAQIGAGSSSTLELYTKVLLFQAYFTNWMLLVFNVVVPMYPMDGGRILHAVLWRRMGEHRASDISATVGLVAAMVLVIAGLVTGKTILAAIGFLGGLTCYFEKRRVKMMGGDDPLIAASAAATGPDPAEEREKKRAQKEHEERLKAEAEIDRILEKISKSGMDSLTRKEKKTLESVSRTTESQ
ncbi:MAG: site-2 protease family protein [Planctomycetota bacterium]